MRTRFRAHSARYSCYARFTAVAVGQVPVIVTKAVVELSMSVPSPVSTATGVSPSRSVRYAHKISRAQRTLLLLSVTPPLWVTVYGALLARSAAAV
jgi:hypothetical protein